MMSDNKRGDARTALCQRPCAKNQRNRPSTMVSDVGTFFSLVLLLLALNTTTALPLSALHAEPLTASGDSAEEEQHEAYYYDYRLPAHVDLGKLLRQNATATSHHRSYDDLVWWHVYVWGCVALAGAVLMVWGLCITSVPPSCGGRAAPPRKVCGGAPEIIVTTTCFPRRQGRRRRQKRRQGPFVKASLSDDECVSDYWSDNDDESSLSSHEECDDDDDDYYSVTTRRFHRSFPPRRHGRCEHVLPLSSSSSSYHRSGRLTSISQRTHTRRIIDTSEHEDVSESFGSDLLYGIHSNHGEDDHHHLTSWNNAVAATTTTTYRNIEAV